MADLTKTVKVLFQGDDEISPSIKAIGKSIDGLGEGISDFGQPFADATEKVLALNLVIAGLAVAGIKAASDIETQANRMAASLGLPTEEAERFTEIAKEAYSAGFGDDLIQTFDAVTLAQKKFGDNASVDIGKVTEQAFKLQGVFGVDFDKSLSAAKNLMTSFGLTSTQAFDFIAKGFQGGLDGSDDFLQSITEYSTQFANGGADAGEFFSVMSSGFQEGFLGADKAADLFKEFRVRIQDGSKTTKEALESIGLDPDKFAAGLASGSTSAVDAFNIIQTKLNETTDRSVQLNAGVGLMGTQFEDLGTAAALAINTTNTGLADMQGKIDGMDTLTFEKKFTSVIRTITTEFGDLSLWEDAKTRIGQVFVDVAASFGPAMDNIDLSGIEDAVGEIWSKIQRVFVDNDLDLTTTEGMTRAVQLVVDSLESLADVTSGIITVLSPVPGIIKGIVEEFNDLPDGVKEAAGIILGLGTALTTLGAVVATGGAIVSGIGTIAGLFGTGGALATGITSILGLITGPAGLVVGFGALAAAAGAVAYDAMLSDSNEALRAAEDHATAIDSLIRKMEDIPAEKTVEIFTLIETGELEAAEKLISELTEQEKTLKIRADAETRELTEFTESWDSLALDKTFNLAASINAGDFAVVDGILEDIPAEKTVVVDADTEPAMEEISVFNETTGETITIMVPVETTGLDRVQKEIADIPTEKILELKIQGDIDKQIAAITAQADTAQAAFEWTAKVDIAEVQAAADVSVAAFDGIAVSVDALAGSTSSMFGDLLSNWEKLSGGEQRAFERELEKQSDLEAAALESQIKLNDAHVKNLEAQTKARERGDAMIEIDTSGLEPALDMIFWQIIEKAQIRGIEENPDFVIF